MPGRDFEPIRINIELCDLNQGPQERQPYIGLSYMWDQGGKSKHIECDDSRIEVGENLWQFLLHYRQFQASRHQRDASNSDSTRLWIDAISIDQSNVQERSQQVALMRDIYTGAESVIVWLGLSKGSEELAFLLTRYPDLLEVDEMSTALAELLQKPYWQRVWVVQEFVLAKSVDIWCGDFRVKAKDLEGVWRGKGALLPFQIDQSAGMHLFRFKKKHRNTAKVKREPLGRRNSKTLRSTRPLRELLETFEGARSTLAYDKIYGFLGIATDGYGDKIVPDYSIQPVELLVSVLRNQCSSTPKTASNNDYKFLTWLMRTLKISRAELIRHVLRHCPEVQQYLFVLTVSDFMVASISFVSTIQDIGSYMEEAEARMPSTWKPKWLQASSMHPSSLTAQDLQDLGQAIATPNISIALDFADAYVPGRPYIGTAVVRGKLVTDSTDMLISQIIQSTPEHNTSTESVSRKHSLHEIREALGKSINHSAELYTETRPHLIRRSTVDGMQRFVSFKGTNGYIGIACVQGIELFAGDRICTFAGITDSNNAFIARLRDDGKWSIIGFAILVLPPDLSQTSIQRADTDTTMYSQQSSILSRQPTLETDRPMCFHCHLTDLLELQRCRILNDVQMSRMLEHTLRLDTINELHQCNAGEGKLDVLEFGA